MYDSCLDCNNHLKNKRLRIYATWDIMKDTVINMEKFEVSRWLLK